MRPPYFIICIILGIGAVFFYAQALTGTGTVDENISLEVRVYNPTPTPTPEPTPTSTSTPTPGGGGGGPITPVPAAVEFRGYTYSGAAVNILKDGVSAGLAPADDAGNFTHILSGLSGGTYNFGFWAQDKTGRRSITFTFQLTLSGGSTTKVSGIVLPPTISLNKYSFIPGENVIVSGVSVPNSQVKIHIESEPQEFLASVSQVGDYSYTFSTATLEKGAHTAKSKTEILSGDLDSIFSQLVAFGVGVAAPQKEYAANPDINSDKKVDLVDFSIMAYWWKKKLPPNSPVDLNGDGILNLADFSILAFNWSG